ncbi:metaxin-1 homolog [Episyrphus balteatus]|uniref:metaxin-1 homolog n=1 Tax=Episyrphus balteatus TaxID=286459 RepID=UPI0024866221|nr:metaxin-1 homolog [Episyrphus balteatus]
MRLGAILYVYKGEWGLPSIDFECLRALCLIKFTRCPVKIETNSNPLRSGSGKLPYLQIGNQKIVGYRQIKELLDKEGYPVDANLTPKQKFLSVAHTNYVFNNLHAYFNYFMFGEANNIDCTRALYAKRTPFPFNFYYPGKYHKEAHNIVSILGGFDLNDKVDVHETDYLVANAKKCVNMLAKKLGKKVWFFGDFYSEFDAIVYAYLSVLYSISLPNNPLQYHIKSCQNLVNFINRISKDVFKQETFNSVKTAKGITNDPMLTPTERDFLESEKKTKIIAATVAVVAMGTFAAWKGFYQSIVQSNNYYDGYDYGDDDDDDTEGE